MPSPPYGTVARPGVNEELVKHSFDLLEILMIF